MGDLVEWQQLVVTLVQENVKMSQECHRLIVVLQAQAGQNVLCSDCQSVCGEGTKSMSGKHVVGSIAK